jgi:hypothetical protein
MSVLNTGPLYFNERANEEATGKSPTNNQMTGGIET